MIIKLIAFIYTVTKRVTNNLLTSLSAQLAFYILLSFFPFMIFMSSLISYIPIEHMLNLLSFLEFYPDVIQDTVYTLVDQLYSYKSNAILSITAIATLWSASRGVFSILKGLNIAHNLKETRNYVVLRIICLFYTLIFAFILVLTFILLIFGQLLLDWLTNFISFSDQIMLITNIIRFLVPFVLIFIFFVFIYKTVPNMKLTLKQVLPGSALTTIGWVVMSLGFSIYVNNFSSYSYIYGSLSSIIVLLLWLYISSNIIMIGGAVNAILIEWKDLEMGKKIDNSSPPQLLNYFIKTNKK